MGSQTPPAPSPTQGGRSDVMDGRRTIMAMGANMRHVRHAEILGRWPVIAEEWAKAVESHAPELGRPHPRRRQLRALSPTRGRPGVA